MHLKSVVKRTKLKSIATIFGYTVNNPQCYGVIEFNKEGKPVSIEEKPEKPKGNKAVVGLYFYPNEVINVSKMIKPSKRGELEITSINKYFLDKKALVETLEEDLPGLIRAPMNHFF